MLKFINLERHTPQKRPADTRARDFHEIYADYLAEKAAEQASRCSQCGVPFCQVHCPLSEQYPGLAEADGGRPARRGLRTRASDQQHAGDLRAHLSAGPAVRRQLRHRAVGPWHGHHRRRREIHHRHRLGEGLGEAAEAATPARANPSASSARDRRASPPPKSCAAKATGSRSMTGMIARAGCSSTAFRISSWRRTSSARRVQAARRRRHRIQAGLRSRPRRLAGRIARAARRRVDRHRRLQAARDRSARCRLSAASCRRSTISSPPTAKASAMPCPNSTPARSTRRARTWP